MEKQDLLVPCSLGCTVYGIWVSFCEIFGCQVNFGNFLVPAFVIACVVTLLLMPWRWRASLGILAVGTLALVWYGSRHMERLMVEAEGLLYYVNRQYYDYYGAHLLERCREYGMDRTLLWMLLGIAFSAFMVVFAFRLRNLQYGFLPAYLVVGAGLVVGKTPAIRGTVFLLVGLVLAMFWSNGQEWGGRSHFRIMKVARRGANWHRYPLFLLLLAAVLLTAVRFARGTEGKWLSQGKKVQEMQRNLEEKVTQAAVEISRFVQGNYNVDSNGKLNNNEPKYAERPVMEITMSEKPRADLYLKGFVGSHYSNGEWKREDVEIFEGLFPTDESKYALDDLAGENLNRWVAWQLDKIGKHSVMEAVDAGDDNVYMPTVDKGEVPHMQQMQIDFVGGGRWSNYTYLPYFASLDGVYDVGEDRSLAEMNSDFLKGDSSRPKVSSPYYLDYVAMTDYDLFNYYMSCEKLDDWADIPCPVDFSEIEGSPMQKNGEKLQELLIAFSQYHDKTLTDYLAYAWNEYGYQGESRFFKRKDYLKKLKKFNTEYRKKNKLRGMSSIDRVQLVQRILKEEASYSKILEKVPEGEDYAEYFLLTQKKGFCEHFATAGTLLMRELGIPSRYVGGYKVPVDRFQKDGDGKYTAEVLDSDAHAWTEIMAGSLGWLPADMTPSSDSRNREKKKVVAATPTPKPKKTKRPKITATPKAKPTPTVKATPTATAVQKKGQQKKKKVALPGEFALLGKVAAGLGGIMLLAVLGILGSRVYYGGRKRRLLHARGKSRNLYVRMRLHDLLSLLRGCGVPISAKMPEGQWFPAIKKFCEDSLSGGEVFSGGEKISTRERLSCRDLEEFLRIVQKAAFSKEEVTQEEYEAFRSQCGKLDEMAWKKAGKMRRLYLKLMGKYGNI